MPINMEKGLEFRNPGYIPNTYMKQGIQITLQKNKQDENNHFIKKESINILMKLNLLSG